MARKEQNIPLAAISGTARVDKTETKVTKDDLAKRIERMRARDAELVAGRFKNLESPGQGARFNYKMYPGDEFVTYELYDNERYRLPRGVARWLNTNCYYKEYKHLQGEMGKGDAGLRAAYNDGRLRAETMQASRKVHRFSFDPLEFMDDDLDIMGGPNLYEVSVDPSQIAIR